MATDLPRFTITIPVDLLAEIEQYQIDNNFISRSAAIQDLINCGIDSLVEKGIISRIGKRPTLSGEALKIAKQYDGLSKRDKLIVRTVVDILTESRAARPLHLVQQAAHSGDLPDELLTDEELKERAKHLGGSRRPGDTDE